MPRAMFVFEHGDLSIAESPEQAAAQLEAVDVEAGAYDAVYDEGGWLYRCRVEDGRVRIDATAEQDFSDLVARLSRFAELTGLPFRRDDADFPLNAARQIAAWQWQQRWPKRPLWLARRLHRQGPPTFKGRVTGARVDTVRFAEPLCRAWDGSQGAMMLNMVRRRLRVEFGCDYCADDQSRFYGHITQISSNEERRTILLRCPRCGALYENTPAGTDRMRRLTPEEARELFPGAI
jgi:hypothetical protein